MVCGGVWIDVGIGAGGAFGSGFVFVSFGCGASAVAFAFVSFFGDWDEWDEDVAIHMVDVMGCFVSGVITTDVAFVVFCIRSVEVGTGSPCPRFGEAGNTTICGGGVIDTVFGCPMSPNTAASDASTSAVLF